MGPVMVDGVQFTRRRLTGRAILDLQAAQQTADDATDIRAGLEVQMHHLAQRLEALADTDGEFPTADQDALTAARKELRARLVEARGAELRSQMGVLIARCEPVDGVDAEWCLKHIEFPGDFERIMGDGDVDPPAQSAATGTAS